MRINCLLFDQNGDTKKKTLRGNDWDYRSVLWSLPYSARPPSSCLQLTASHIYSTYRPVEEHESGTPGVVCLFCQGRSEKPSSV